MHGGDFPFWFDRYLLTDLSQDDINKLSQELQVILDTIEEKELRWFELSEKLEG